MRECEEKDFEDFGYSKDDEKKKPPYGNSMCASDLLELTFNKPEVLLNEV